MCDKCGTVFSENEDGWQTFTATTTKYDDSGQARQIQQRLDACPSCSLVPKRQFAKELEAHMNGDEQAQKIAKLEREVGIDEETGTFAK